jgi:hypothetical protein
MSILRDIYSFFFNPHTIFTRRKQVREVEYDEKH